MRAVTLLLYILLSNLPSPAWATEWYEIYGSAPVSAYKQNFYKPSNFSLIPKVPRKTENELNDAYFEFIEEFSIDGYIPQGEPGEQSPFGICSCATQMLSKKVERI